MSKTAFILSDIHVDHYFTKKKISDAEFRSLFQIFIELKPDFVFMAGDISNRCSHTVQALNWFGEQCEGVYFVWGNHDRVYDKGSEYCIKQRNRGMKYTVAEYYNAMKSKMSKNVHCLDGNILQLTEKSTIGGCMGMYDFSYSADVLKMTKEFAIHRWNNWYDSYWGINEIELKMLVNSELEKIDSILLAKPTYMMTHMVPSNDWVLPKHRDSHCTSYFNFDGKEQMNKMCTYGGKAWICGHTHDRFIKQHNSLLIYNNSFGYPREHNPYSDAEKFLIEIE